MYYNADISYNSTNVGLTLCCNYGIGRVYLPSVKHLLFRKDFERTYFITHGTGNIVNFNNSHCHGLNFTLLLVRIDNNFITSVHPTVNCSDPSHIISENNVLTVNITNITKINNNNNKDESDRYIVFRDYNVENNSIIVSFAKLYVFKKSTLNNVTITRCINTDTGYRVPIYNPITLRCDVDCVFSWRISSFIYYTFIYHKGGPSNIRCDLNFID